jgi:putative ABC transport system substrate-binding protein
MFDLPRCVEQHMKRREFLCVLGGTAILWPLGAHTQSTILIGFLHSGSQANWGHALTAFRGSLSEAGYVESQNMKIEYRWADDQYNRLPSLALDLVDRKPSLIVAGGGSIAAIAAKRATSTVPIVFAMGADPVKMGLVASFNRPGANVTGVTFLLNALVAKRFELLRQLVPSVRLIGIIVNPDNPNAQNDVRDAQDAARTLDVQTYVANIRSENETEAAFESLRQQKAGALLVLPDPNFASRRNQIISLAARHSLPAIYFGREFVEAGGLMTYSASITNAFQLAGKYVDRILKGEKPADLPIQQPTKYELIINLKTAKTLGLSVSQSLQVAADELIE